jgi:hypothetical protein
MCRNGESYEIAEELGSGSEVDRFRAQSDALRNDLLVYIRPHSAEQSFLRHQPTRVVEKIEKQLERFRFDGEFLFVAPEPQFPLRYLEFVEPEHLGLLIYGHSSPPAQASGRRYGEAEWCVIQVPSHLEAEGPDEMNVSQIDALG